MDETIKKNRGSDIKMDIEECKETYEMLKKSKQFVANVDKDFFLKFAETVLSELEKKDKVINEMAKHIHLSGDYECLNKECEDDGNKDCEECIKEYFYKKVEGKL